MEWSNFQTEIFHATKHDDANLSVQAVAGSGKSTTLFEIANRCTGNVLFLAFNKIIAEYAKNKMGSSVDCRTFHSYGLGLLKQEIGWYPKVDSNKVYDAIKLRHPYVRGEWSPRKVINRSIKKMRGLGFMSYDGADIQDFLFDSPGCFSFNPKERAREENWIFQNLGEISYMLEHLDQLPTKSKDAPKYRTIIDFDDMVRYPCIYNLALRKRVYANTVLVDEAQDMNPYQIHLINQLFQKDVRTICVGDSNQAIYAFRGAYADSMERLAKMTDARELPLSVTYRCREAIVTFTNERIRGSEMIHHKDGGQVETILREEFVSRVRDEQVPMIIGAKNKSLIRAWLDLAKAKIASTLKDKGITLAIRDILKDFGAVPVDGEPPQITIDALVIAVSDAIAEGFKDNDEGEKVQTLPSGTVDLYGCIGEIVEAHEITHYTQFLNLLDEMDQDSDHELHTVHSAKGLESPKVIVLCDWFKNDQLDNMKYVAYTRAEDKLLLVEDWEREEDVA